MLRYLICFIFALQALQANPWGKDADLAIRPRCISQNEASGETGIGISVAEALINFHQEVISPADGPRSNFIPSSSQYTKEAIKKYGFLKGYIMGCDRLMRENSEEWVYRKGLNENGYTMKVDPVR